MCSFKPNNIAKQFCSNEGFELPASFLPKLKLAVKRGLCLKCLGRLVAKIGHGLENEERGRIVLKRLAMEQKHRSRAKFLSLAFRRKCPLCEGMLSQIDRYVALIEEKLKAWEYSTFLIGSRVDAELVEREETLWAELGLTNCYEPLKTELNREVGKELCRKTGKTVDFVHPDIMIIVDTRYDNIELQVNPLYVYGRYRKLVRGIPQTKWPCVRCLGKGCRYCDWKGKMYEESVEELIAAELMKATGGTAQSFHGMGREDIDARMLGTGRPFILEIQQPRKRNLQWKKVEKKINFFASGKIEVKGLRKSTASEVVQLKEARPLKTYRVEIEFDRPLSHKKLKDVVSVFPLEVVQQTPRRVAHRRADIQRKRKIFNTTIEQYGRKRAVLQFTTAAGTYIKELIHGDEGRTTPNLADLLGVRCSVKALDVLAIHDTNTQGSSNV